MSTRDQLNQYLRGLEKRLRFLVVSRGVAVALGVALGATLALVLITNAFAFSATSMAWARVVLFVALAVALGFALVIPLVQLNRRRAATRAEAACPEFEERLLTYVERADQNDPMLELLAMDTLDRAPKASAARVIPPKSIFAFATSAGAAGAVLLWLILAGPGFLGYGSALLWAGPSKIGPAGGYYSITVEPGNKLIRRKSDQLVTATLSGFQAPLVRMMARYKSSSKWEEAPMAPRANGSSYEFLFAALPEPVEYYIEAAGVRSPTYKLDVIDLPAITRVKVTYHFPSWLGIPNQVEDPGGDLRAVAGTVAELQVQTDRPLKNGVIEMEDGSKISLEGSGNTLIAKVPIQKDGAYHFAANESSESVRLSDDYFIEAKSDQAPSVKITKPGADAKVSPIEEVSVQVEASDDFALQQMDLHYSVNGSPEKVVDLLPQKGTATASGKTTLYLEDFKMQPGDVVSMYATAKDARTVSRTDIMFIEAQPFEKNYTQSQQMGGGGGGGGGGQQDQEEISRRQKEIIAATWNAVRGGAKDRSASADNAQFLSEVQQKLKEQTESLAQRATSRELAGANQEFQSFVKDMQEAAAQMGPASTKLKGLKWQDALEPEQKALQHLLRAESTFRDIQVAFGNQGGGGGGGGGGAGRDLASLFDLELDTEKNQYESGQQQSSAEQKQKDIDEALNRLDQLARRQQELAQQQQNNKQQTLEQRRQQELLRREAEDLKKQMEQMTRQGQQGQQGQSGQSGQSSSSGQQSSQQSNSQQSKSGQQQQQQNASQQQLQRALDQLKQATDDMRSAQQGSQNGQQSAASEADARRAAERLKEATDSLSRMRRQDASAQLGELQDKADKLAQQQHDFENRLKKAVGNAPDQGNFRGTSPGGMSREQANQMASEKEKMGADLDQLEKDLQKSARDLAGAQPDASARLRQGLSEIQQNEAKLRMKYSADGIRQGLGSYMVPREGPITQTLDKVTDDIRQAQSAMKDGNQQAGAQGDMERQLARVERLRQQMERMSGQQQGNRQGNQPGGQQQGGQPGGQQQGKQGGQQPGGQQPGQQPGGQQPGGQQGGGQQGGQQAGGQQAGGQQGGGQQGGGSRNGGGTNNGFANGYGGGNIDPRDSYGRFNPQGLYQNQPLENSNANDGAQAMGDARRTLEEMRQFFRDNPEMANQIGDLERELQRINVGETASPELQARIGRTILPQLETLEVQMRRQMAEEGGGQVRSGATERAPAGFSESVAEYFRKLSKGK